MNEWTKNNNNINKIKTKIICFVCLFKNENKESFLLFISILFYFYNIEFFINFIVVELNYDTDENKMEIIVVYKSISIKLYFWFLSSIIISNPKIFILIVFFI